MRHGGQLAESAKRPAQLARDCRPDYPIENPVDLGDMAGPNEYGKALDLLLQEPGTDGILVIHAPASVDRADGKRQGRGRAGQEPAADHDLLGGRIVGGSGARAVQDAHIPTYEAPGEAVEAFMRLAQHRRNQELLMETPPSIPEGLHPDTETARRIIQIALTAGRRRLERL
jgi:acetyltransferase